MVLDTPLTLHHLCPAVRTHFRVQLKENIMKKIKTFKREIFERYLSDKDMKELDIDYNNAKLINIGREKVMRKDVKPKE